MKNWKPIFVENSRIPAILSYFAPIQIWAITLFFIVLCKGKLDEVTKRHETIHFQQTLETGVIGMVALYLWDYVHGYIKYRNGAETTKSEPSKKPMRWLLIQVPHNPPSFFVDKKI